VREPPVSSVTVIGEDAPVLVRPEDEVAVKVVTVEPPVAPAVNGTDTTPLVPPEAVPIVGACGTVVAVMLFEADEAELVPAEDVAVNVNVYAVADCNPVTVIGLDDPVPVKPPGLDVTV
jgi:hypothetical protein